jgi:hypothetical protein
MNARVYDSDLGRFLSADTMIPSPYHSQSYNRYSYLNNNPLGDTDSTGHAGDNDRQSAEEFLSEAYAYDGMEWVDANNAIHQTRTIAVKDSKGNVDFAIADLITKSNGDQKMLVVAGCRPIRGQTVMEATLYNVKDGTSRPMITSAYGAIGRNAHATASFENLFGKIATVNSHITNKSPTGRDAIGFSPVVGPMLDSIDAFKAGNIGMGLLWAAMGGLDIVTAGGASKLGMVGKGVVKNTTTLYRAVSKSEIDDIALNGLRVKKGGYEMGKLFATNIEDAVKFGKDNFKLDGIPNHIIEVTVPESTMKSALRFEADFKQAVSIPAEKLNTVSATTLNNSPLVR